MITNFFIPELNNHDVQELWFQQGGATCHIVDLLKDTFGDRLISRFGPVNWPPRSRDLTPLDYFLWDYVNQRSQTLPQITIQLNDGASRTVSKRFVQRLPHRVGFGSRRPTRVPLLNARHRAEHIS
ncbi:uncharacterized protein TNCV_2559361 [Trichonephila clavipes]|nr:uncharacterized protein TNCV_2559361 [Trichonephila clavipes]